MKQIIWKIRLEVGNRDFELMIPANSKILCVQNQLDSAVMWVLCDPNEEKVTRRFTSWGTGHEDDFSDKTYIGTVQIGSLVWHMFERI